MTLVLSRSAIALLVRDTIGTRANKLMPPKPVWLKLCGLILEIRDFYKMNLIFSDNPKSP